MSKVLHMIDFDLLITYRHQEFLIEKGMKESESESESEEESRRLEWCSKTAKYVEVDTYNYDDIPF